MSCFGGPDHALTEVGELKTAGGTEGMRDAVTDEDRDGGATAEDGEAMQTHSFLLSAAERVYTLAKRAPERRRGG